MYYAFLMISAVMIGIQFSLMKIFQNKVGKTVFISLIFSAVCGAIAALGFFIYNGFKLNVSPYTVVCAAIYACILVACNVLGIKALSLGNMSVYSMFMMLGGMLVPFFFGILYLKETLSVLQIIGVLLLCAALVAPCVKSKGAKLTAAFICVCSIIFLLNGSVGIVSKLQQTSPSAVSATDFIILSNLFNAAISSIMALAYFLVVRRRPNNSLKTEFVNSMKRSYIIALYAVISGLGFLLILLSAAMLPASVQYPIISGGAIVISTLFDRFFFKEKLSLITYISIAAAFCATIMFMF